MKKLRNRYSTVRVRQTFDQTDQTSLTHQSHADECDINKILSRYAIQKVGLPEPGDLQYGDISNLQQADPSALIMMSRSKLDALGRDVDKKQKQSAQDKIDADKKILEENQQLKQKLEALESQNSQTST